MPIQPPSSASRSGANMAPCQGWGPSGSGSARPPVVVRPSSSYLQARDVLVPPPTAARRVLVRQRLKEMTAWKGPSTDGKF